MNKNQFPRRAAEASTSEQSVRRYLARIGYARRPTTGNWRHEDLHLARFTALPTAPSTFFPFDGFAGYLATAGVNSNANP